MAIPAFAAKEFESVFFSEILVENRKGIIAENGSHAGWIELYNGGSETVNLAGWCLSDSPANLTKWRFPRVSILPGNYLLVFASGSGRTNDLAHLHTNFQLNKSGGQIVLAGPSTNFVSRLAYPKAAPDVSYGCLRGEPTVRGSFIEPTPGKPNQSSGSGFAPKVTFSRASGSFATSIMVSLGCATNESTKQVIRYTLDGSLPTSTSPIYREPLVLTNSTCIGARVYQDGLLPGPPGSETFVSLGSKVLGFRSTLPVLVMDTLGSERATSLHSSSVQLLFYDPKISLGSQATMATRGGYHQRGSSSSQFPQSSFALQFVDEFNHERNLSVLGLPANSEWVLYAPNMFDPGLIHNPFIHQLSRDMGRYSPRTRFVEVFFAQHAGAVTREDYAGIYVLEEKIKIGKQRVAIDRLGAEDLSPPQVTGGYLLKFDRLGPGEGGLWAGGAEMVYVEPKEAVIELPQRLPQRRYIADYLNEFEQVLQSPDWKDPAKGYRRYIDVDSWIDFHVVEVLSGNVDIFHFSTFFYKPRGGKITFGPHWDFDRALGSIDHRDSYPRRWNTGQFFNGPWWRQLFTDPDFWQLWVDRWQTLRRTNFSEANLFALVDRLADEVREAQPREAARWGLEPRGGSYQSEIDLMKQWLADRIDFIDRQLVQPPELTRKGGRAGSGEEIAIAGPEGATIYYTLDGSDPRLSQGDISPKALVYSGPIKLERDARVTARARDTKRRQTGGPPVSTPWSSAVVANFAIGRP